MPASFAVHGGAGATRDQDYSSQEAHMRELAEQGRARLLDGMSALDAVTWAAEQLEASGLYTAGKGASPNRDGVWELDASIMDGATRQAGAVGCIREIKHPIRAARAVMEHTPHVMLVGAGADAFAEAQGLEKIADPHSYFTPAVRKALKDGELAHGTAGAVARDAEGRLAAATTTGGLLGKMPGRVGDSPLPGSGCWADERVAVSCTGLGEYFIRCAAAADLSARLRYNDEGLAEAADAVLADIAGMGGDGGLIAVDAGGHLVAPFRSSGLKRALAHADGRIEVGAF